ncbi:MAG: UTP--glucose-1-phosphate uridylyltransferase, partial [Lentisphaeraceae bacterium]|nr:UTP--glucose-1-phosphate uridylyltransferase [Lentisphaeraceae bacterium]
MSNLQETLNANKQSHLSSFVQNESLKSQLDTIDWPELNEAIRQCVVVNGAAAIPESYEPARYYPLIAESDEQKKLYQQAEILGDEILAAGKVAAFTVAGGQGTRLGFDGPKGTLSVSPIKNKSLFQLFAEQILGRSEKYDVEIPWNIMCSPLNN